MKRYPSLLRPLVFFCAVVATAVTDAGAQTCSTWHQRVAPNHRYLDNGDGTVTDQQTGLMWKRCSEGQSGTACSGTLTLHSWSVALTAAASSSFAGHSDWRLPSAKELLSLAETGCHSPAINVDHFPNTPIAWFWTSTTLAFNGSYAWHIFFRHGNANAALKSSEYVGVRLVRGGR